MREIKLQDLKKKSPTELLSFAEDRNSHSSRFYRIINEAPTAIMILVVFLVVMKP